MRDLFLSDFETVKLAKVAILGTTLTIDGALERASGPYSSVTSRLYRHAGLVRMRDSYSAGVVSNWRTDGVSLEGIDLAFLLESEASRSSVSSGITGYYFGRSRDADMTPLKEFVKSLAAAADLKMEEIPYRPKALQRKCSHRITKKDCYFCMGQARQLRVQEVLHLVSKCDYVITDTYHLGVLSWSIGVPAIMIGNSTNGLHLGINGGPRFQGFDKRLALYSALDALPYFIPIEELREDQKVSELRRKFVTENVIENPKFSEYVAANIRARKEKLLHALRDWFFQTA